MSCVCDQVSVEGGGARNATHLQEREDDGEEDVDVRSGWQTVEPVSVCGRGRVDVQRERIAELLG